MASFILESAVPYFPRGSIHLAVVDPGVGTDRLPLVVVCKRGMLVGPDNGLLVRAAERLGFNAAYRIDSRRFKGEKVSATFHGRDIFARTVGNLANGLKPHAVGGRVKTLVRLNIPLVSFSGNKASCTVLYVDSFGNVILNLVEEDAARLGLYEREHLKIGTKRGRFPGLVASTYSDIPRGQLGIIQGSQGYLEIAMRERSAAARLGLKPLDGIAIRLS